MIVITSIITLIILVVAVILYYDIGGVYSRIFTNNYLDEGHQNIAYKKETDKDKLEHLNIELDIKEKELLERETNLLEKEKEVEILLEQLSAKFEDIQNMTRLYEKMDAQKASSIMLKAQEKEINASILKHMNKTKAAEILSAMDDSSAAEILYMLLPEVDY